MWGQFDIYWYILEAGDFWHLKVFKLQKNKFKGPNLSRQKDRVTLELQWPELQERRQQASLTFFNKIHNNLVTIDKNRYLCEAGVNRSTRSHPF